MADNVMPNDIRVAAGEEYTPRTIDIFDAVTGAKVPGVLEVNISLSHSDMRVEVVHTLHWPTEASDWEVNLSEIELKRRRIVQGVACGVTRYWLKLFEGTARQLSDQ